jgi:hypothetical protein
MLSTYNLLFNQIKTNLNCKLKVHVLNLGVVASVIKNKNPLICFYSYASTVYAKNFLFSLLINMLFKQQTSSNWSFNKLFKVHKGTKMLLEQGVTLLAKTKAVLPAKCLSLVET